MKKNLLLWYIFLIGPHCYNNLSSCPTCLGRSRIHTKQLFAKDFYKAEKEQAHIHATHNKVSENNQPADNKSVPQNETEQINQKEQS